MTVIKMAMLLFLTAASFIDLKEKKIPVLYVATGFVSGVAVQLVTGRMAAYEIIGGCLTGIFILLFAFLTKGQVGYGDGLMLVATGAFLGLVNNIILLLISFLIAGICGMALMLIKNKKNRYRLPFIPFMLAGYVIVLMINRF